MSQNPKREPLPKYALTVGDIRKAVSHLADETPVLAFASDDTSGQDLIVLRRVGEFKVYNSGRVGRRLAFYAADRDADVVGHHVRAVVLG